MGFTVVGFGLSVLSLMYIIINDVEDLAGRPQAL